MRLKSEHLSEYKLQKECNALLKKLKVYYSHMEKGRGKNTTHRAGIPDLTICPGYGFCFFVELKTSEGKLNDKQKETRDRLIKEGYKYYVCRSYIEFVEVLTACENPTNLDDLQNRL